MNIPSNRIYFKGFNALRFYAALSVVVQHVSYSPHDWFRVPRLDTGIERFFLNGTDAVNLFFTLSGFLITYLLLAEHGRKGTVNIRNFYIRRTLRIWPVYYLMLIVAVLLVGRHYDPLLLLLSFVFLNNLAFVLYFPFPPLEHLWSIAVEEQYYLVAPILARFAGRIQRLLLGFIAFYWALLLFMTWQPIGTLSALLEMSRFDFIAVGGVLAYAHYHGQAWLGGLRHPILQLGAALLVLYAIIFVEPTNNFFHTTPIALAFAILIYNMAAGAGWGARLERPFLNYLGNLSYSLYVYHPLIVLLFYLIFHSWLPAYRWLAYPAIISLSLGLSALSYHYYERPILRFKERFGRDAKPQIQSASAD